MCVALVMPAAFRQGTVYNNSHGSQRRLPWTSARHEPAGSVSFVLRRSDAVAGAPRLLGWVPEMTASEHFKASVAFEDVKRRQDRLTYTPGVVFSLLMVGDAFIGEHFGRGPAAVLGVPLLAALPVWWFMLARASVRTWRTLAAEQRAWKAQQHEDAGST